MRDRFVAITGLHNLSSIELNRKVRDENFKVEVDKSLEDIFGKRIIYKGSGSSLDIDRLFIRDKLNQVMSRSKEDPNSQRRFLLKSVTLYLPCSILSSNSEILDSPGTGDLDPLNSYLLSKHLKHTSNLFMIMHRSLQEAQNLYELLEGSSFLTKVINNPERRKIISINYREKNNQNYSFERFISSIDEDSGINQRVYDSSYNQFMALFTEKLLQSSTNV